MENEQAGMTGVGAAPVPQGPTPAGFWVRGGAVLIDTVVLVGAGFTVNIVMTFGGVPNIVSQLIGFLIPVAYSTWMIGSFGQTVGKMAAGISVIEAGGGVVSYPRALGRTLATYLSGLLLCVGYLIAASPSKKALHDYIAGTRVVYPEPVGTGRQAAMVCLGVLTIILPFALGAAIALNPTISALFQKPGETQSTYDKFSSLSRKASEGATKGGLGALRSATSIYYGDLEGVYPSDPAAELSPRYVQDIPVLWLAEHGETTDFQLYGGEVCTGSEEYGEEIDGTKIKDTGKWGYVSDQNASCWGQVFVDCTHTDSRGKVWHAF